VNKEIKMRALLFSVLILLASVSISAQEASPTPPDEPIRIFTEEVHINVIAQSAYSGEKVPDLQVADLLVVESGDPQDITSLRQFPASVLILLDTGRELNVGKDNVLTRLMAKVLVKTLSDKDTISVMQYYDKIEIISAWTKDKASISENLDKRMFLGKRSCFVDALNQAVESFQSRPLENRNLVLISDGLETVREEADFQAALRKVLEANISVHIISYTTLQRQNAARKNKRFTINKEKTPPRIPDYIFENILNGITVSRSERERLKVMMNEQQRIGIINLDKEMIKFVENKRNDWAESEEKLKKLALETGGEFHAPESTEYMLRFADDVSRAIGSQYVITYTPTKSFADSKMGNERKIRVSTHRLGVRIKARQKLFISEDVKKEN
jgi:VWFA-related protein